MKTFLIDDDPISLFLTEQLLSLEGLGAQVVPFGSAEEAFLAVVQALPHKAPMLVFLDLEMPVLNGWEFLKALEPYTPVLAQTSRFYILTSSLAKSDLEKCNEFPLVQRLLHKPLKQEDIALILEEMQSSQLQAELQA
ncbi:MULTISPECIES: response regulator [Rufibacter]|uniref:CheY-like chemotaxis protein n=1 Tax=Rufibacter quisquiliarum TaxID=1549639 RepID=A0A839GIA2_9BACT|nr:MULTISPECIES: response regulator [Rufibacter]MBA9076449.1 CheY-like chemotaxis protein [Rufibacter quisquiliarum]